MERIVRDPVYVFYPMVVCGLIFGIGLPLTCGLSFVIGLHLVWGCILELMLLTVGGYGACKLFF